MRAPRLLPVLLLAILAGACRGEVVDQPTASSDAQSDAPVDAPIDPCNPPGNLVPNGTFQSGTSGWMTDHAKLEVIDGPCAGKGVRVYEVSSYGSVSRKLTKKLPAGQRLRLRAWFKGMPGAGDRTPSLFIRALRRDDAGAEIGDNLEESVDSEGSADWTMGESFVTLPYDVFGLDVIITSRTPGSDEFAVGGISVVPE